MDNNVASWLTEEEAEQIERQVTNSGFAGLPMAMFTVFMTMRLLWPKVWKEMIG